MRKCNQQDAQQAYIPTLRKLLNLQRHDSITKEHLEILPNHFAHADCKRSKAVTYVTALDRTYVLLYMRQMPQWHLAQLGSREYIL